MPPRVSGLRLSTFLVTSCLAVPASAATIEVGPADDVEGAIAMLQPGDELVLRGGAYSLSGRFGISIAGTEAMPIVIRSREGEVAHLHRDLADQNIVDIDSADWVVLRGIEFSGGSAGIRVSAATHLTIEGCEVHDTGDVAIRFNDTGARYDSIRIVRNHVHHTNGTGEGMYLGCNSNACQFANGLVEGNYVHHTNQATVEQGDGIELKEGSFNTVIRDNVIHDTHYPCILTYSTVGNGAPNVIERNALWHCGDHGIQSAADAIIRNNVILSAASDGIAMQPHQAGIPSNLVVAHNTVFDSGGAALSLRSNNGSVVIANNALFASTGDALLVVDGDAAMVVVTGNVVEGATSVSSGVVPGDLVRDFVSAGYAGAPPMDPFPKAGGALVGMGDVAYVATDDFNGTARDGVADVGAYKFDPAGNPGWVLAEAPKASGPVPPPPGTDAGVPPPGTDGGTTAAPPDTGSGCGCRVARDDRFIAASALAVATSVLVTLRARRRRARVRAPRARRS